MKDKLLKLVSKIIYQDKKLDRALIVLSIILALLKLLGMIDWSWMWILFPLWGISAGYYLVIFSMAVIQDGQKLLKRKLNGE